jgi:hypothetical protein
MAGLLSFLACCRKRFGGFGLAVLVFSALCGLRCNGLFQFGAKCPSFHAQQVSQRDAPLVAVLKFCYYSRFGGFV